MVRQSHFCTAKDSFIHKIIRVGIPCKSDVSGKVVQQVNTCKDEERYAKILERGCGNPGVENKAAAHIQRADSAEQDRQENRAEVVQRQLLPNHMSHLLFAVSNFFQYMVAELIL